jgi:hypothetical protein
MKLKFKVFLLSCMVLTAAEAGLAQPKLLPRFEQYSVSKTFSGKPAAVNLRSHPKARLFRTALKLGSEKGPNFAGHYTVATWGCGSDCRMVAVIDAITGKVYFAPFQVSTGASFHVDSRLLVANESEIERYLAGEEMLDVYMPGWYIWRNGKFIQIFKSRAEAYRNKNRRSQARHNKAFPSARMLIAHRS